MTNKTLLSFGVVTPVVFWMTTVICGSMIDGYNHLQGMVSELGVLGSNTQYIFTIGLDLSALFSIFFSIGLWRYCRERRMNVLPVLLLANYLFLIGPATIPMPLPLHGVVGLPFMLLIFSPLVALLVWRGERDYLQISVIAFGSLCFLGLAFLVYFPDILSQNFGLKQRFLYLGWTIWSVGLSFIFIKDINRKLLNVRVYN